MREQSLGSQGLTASVIGLGCMGMSDFYGSHDDSESLKVLDRAIELGVTFWDTADMYGPFTNEELVGKALKKHRANVTLATKFGIVRDPNDPGKRGINGKPDYVQSSCEGSLKRLGVESIDLYYLHRKDPATDIEITVGAMGKLVQQGKVRALGLSEVSPATLRKAHAVHPISAVQTEYSLWSREPEEEMLATCKELGVAFVAYSPLGRGFLTGQIKKFEDLEQDDYRRHTPRFQGKAFDKNIQLVKKIEEIAAAKGCTTAQLALAWVLAQGDHIFPIPGTKHINYLEDNAGAADLTLTKEELQTIEGVFPQDEVEGLRYPESFMHTVNQ